MNHVGSIHNTDVRKETFELLVPKQGTMQDALGELKKKADLDDEAIADTQLYSTQGNKISRELAIDYPVTSLIDHCMTLAQQLPKDMLEASAGDRPAFVFHFDKEVSRTHGIPFKIFLKAVSAFQSMICRPG